MVFKTRIKRSELIFNIIILALFAVVAATQILSAYGAMCVVWDIPTGMPSPPFPADHSWFDMMTHVGTFSWVYQPSNVITWIVAFAYGFLIYFYFTKMPWKRFFIIAMVVSFLGFITGLLPAIISDTAGFTEAFDFGTPNWGRTIGNLLVMVVLVMMNFVPRFKVATKKFIEASDVSGRYVKQLILMSLFFFWLAAVSFLGTEFMRGAHVVGGINVWTTVDFQFLGGVITSVIGTSMLSTALVYSQIRPSSALIRTK
ncbi:MAG: hypothetical protein KGD70_11960 [Candidatus Lokiarchaeota archaeon]|nr:hypothetical protein [Candidatus Lokiarchaeota archaeon]